jgi:hypothetical protein
MITSSVEARRRGNVPSVPVFPVPVFPEKHFLVTQRSSVVSEEGAAVLWGQSIIHNPDHRIPYSDVQRSWPDFSRSAALRRS